jgi:predicted nucleotidyltransferase
MKDKARARISSVDKAIVNATGVQESSSIDAIYRSHEYPVADEIEVSTHDAPNLTLIRLSSAGRYRCGE